VATVPIWRFAVPLQSLDVCGVRPMPVGDDNVLMVNWIRNTEWAIKAIVKLVATLMPTQEYFLSLLQRWSICSGSLF
jgi:hypothetical protein